MRWVTILLVLFLLGVSAVPVDAEVIPARLASGRIPIPTFKEVHRAYFRISLHESGWVSLADQDGILESMLFAGGGRIERRGYRGQGYGLDYAKLMRRMVVHSKRTFPSNSKFMALFTPAALARIEKRKTERNRWVSTMELDCQEPEGWHGRVPFRAHFAERCESLVDTTRSFLKGQIESYCDGQPTTWGNEADIKRPGGALERGWREVVCDRPNPEKPNENCDKLTKPELLNSKTCARNTFWTWLETTRPQE